MSKQDGNTPDRDVPGNSVQSALQQERWLLKLGQSWVRFVDSCERLAGHGIEVDGLSIKYDFSCGGEILVVLRGLGTEGYVVAFHSTADPYGLWTSLVNRIDNGSLQWRKDEFRNGR